MVGIGGETAAIRSSVRRMKYTTPPVMERFDAGAAAGPRGGLPAGAGVVIGVGLGALFWIGLLALIW